jgi:hypothetical protein
MWPFTQKEEPPLHQAIIDNDKQAITSLSRNPENLISKNTLNFTALELSRYLGCPLLQPNKTIKLLKNGEAQVQELTTEEFETFFSVRYLFDLNFQNYDFFKKSRFNCPYLLRLPLLTPENYDLMRIFFKEIATGESADVTIQWINKEIGYGLFSNKELPIGSFVGEYTGRVRRFYRRTPKENIYCFHYPTRLWSLQYSLVDAMCEGNEMRFINHSDSPNLEPACLVDRGILHIVFLACKLIAKGEQLTFDYGDDFWKKKQQFLSTNTS